MQQQQDQGTLLHGNTMADFSRLEAEANAKTSKTKAQLDSLATTQKVGIIACNLSNRFLSLLCYSAIRFELAGDFTATTKTKSYACH